jgi:hypothetical protein
MYGFEVQGLYLGAPCRRVIFIFWGGPPWGTTHPPNPPSSAPTQTKWEPICSLNSASIDILIKVWNLSVAELWGKTRNTDAHAYMTYQAPTSGLHSPTLLSSFICANFHWLSRAGTILEVWSGMLLHWLDSRRSLHLNACASDFWTCPQTPPFTQFAQKGWQSTELELRIPVIHSEVRGSGPEFNWRPPPN